jgi:hypothetical protein
MTARATAALPEPWPAARAGSYGRTCVLMAAGWAVPQAAACALVVILELMPAPTPDGRSLSIWLEIAMIPVGLSAPTAVLLTAPLFLTGFRYLHRVVRAGRRWVFMWAAVMAAGIALETVLVLTVMNDLVPRGVSYPVPAQLSWGWLTLGTGFMATATAMTWVLTRATRLARHHLPAQVFPA